MVLPIILAFIAPLILLLRRRSLVVEIQTPLIATVLATLLVVTGAMWPVLLYVQDPLLFLLLVFCGAPLIAMPVATFTACALTRTSGFAVATALMALGGWMLGMIIILFVDLVVRPNLFEPGMFLSLLVFLSIPASYAATAAVYAAALGRVKT